VKKWLQTMFVASAAALAISGASQTYAQVRKSTTTKTGTIEIIESRDGKFRFTVRNDEGKYVGGSAVGHDTAGEARAAADELKRVIATATFTSRKAEPRDDDDKKPGGDPDKKPPVKRKRPPAGDKSDK
jgi:hypothetical protein